MTDNQFESFAGLGVLLFAGLAITALAVFLIVDEMKRYNATEITIQDDLSKLHKFEVIIKDPQTGKVYKGESYE
jgi:hypothetical protein